MWLTTSRLALALTLLALALAGPSRAQLTLLGSGANQYGGGTPLVSCASTGVFDLSNVCNDIYFIGALK